jgi:hypothetical protein
MVDLLDVILIETETEIVPVKEIKVTVEAELRGLLLEETLVLRGMGMEEDVEEEIHRK